MESTEDSAPQVRARSRSPRRLFLSGDLLCTGVVVITGQQHHYLTRVLRAHVGDALVLFDGHGRDADAEILTISGERATLRVADIRTQSPPTCPLTVALSLIKGERMDSCVQKLVELGADVIVPLITERTVVRVEGKRADKRHQRFVDIAVGATRQSRRVFVPRIAAITTIADFLSAQRTSASRGLKLILSTESDHTTVPLRQALPTATPDSVQILIGPEGGFARAELTAAQMSGFQPVGLGPHILRADTAAIATVAAVKFAFAQIAQ